MRYTEPHRHYHNLDHIGALLTQALELDLGDEQIAAIWFHDAVYDVHHAAGAPTNEELSAQLAVARLTALGWAHERIARVAQIIRDTEQHLPTSPESAAVLDLDLSSLALPVDAYDQNSAAIRREYAHIPDTDFAAGTLAFTARMLARPRLFHTEWGEALERPARNNLRRLQQRWGG